MGSHLLPSNAFFALGVAPQSITSDAVTGEGVPLDGFNQAYALVATGSALDSDATLTVTFQKNAVTNVASDAASSDWATLGTGSYSVTFADSTTTQIALYGANLIKNSLSTGLLRTSTIASDADSAQMSVAWVFTKASQRLPDSDNPTLTEIVPA